MPFRLFACLLLPLAIAASGLFAQSQSPSEPIRIVGLFKVKAGQEAALESLIREAVARTKREDRGFVRYEFFKVPQRRTGSGLASQSADYVLIEEWEDGASLGTHLGWAGAIVKEMREVTETIEFLRLAPEPIGE